MDVSILLQIALSCGVVLLYSLIGHFLLNCLGFRRRSEDQAHDDEKEEEEEEEEMKSDVSATSNDALHLLRLTNAFCPPRTEPSIFGRDVSNPRDNCYYPEDGLLSG
ncbi:hypothetical protein PGT21_011165 [Puccinia graminis f. sp. tritici]|uniref:Uncharacterized protein n=1 Tax=Puccinia graminis f. sp. tritici TaxID=56615 RepID=A0A5B0P932_PUCGR|nr:hypothetical protein PGT21_011165 [Puccinia graminis f. sp. tritici]